LSEFADNFLSLRALGDGHWPATEVTTRGAMVAAAAWTEGLRLYRLRGNPRPVEAEERTPLAHNQ